MKPQDIEIALLKKEIELRKEFSESLASLVKEMSAKLLEMTEKQANPWLNVATPPPGGMLGPQWGTSVSTPPPWTVTATNSNSNGTKSVPISNTQFAGSITRL